MRKAVLKLIGKFIHDSLQKKKRGKSIAMEETNISLFLDDTTVYLIVNFKKIY